MGLAGTELGSLSQGTSYWGQGPFPSQTQEPQHQAQPLGTTTVCAYDSSITSAWSRWPQNTQPPCSRVSHYALVVVGIQWSLLSRVVWSETGLKINMLISKTSVHQVCELVCEQVKSAWGKDFSYEVKSWNKAAFLILVWVWLSPPLQPCFRSKVSSSSTVKEYGKGVEIIHPCESSAILSPGLGYGALEIFCLQQE